MTRFAALALVTLATSLVVSSVHAETVVQISLPGLLDARSVTTLTNGNLVIFTLPTDGGNLQNAFATKAVAQSKGKPVENALPDDGTFPADARHPEVRLHFSNDADAASPQTHLVAPSASFEFPVPVAEYSKLFLFFNGAAGGTTINVTLTYSDAMETKMATIPDYYADVSPTDPVIFNLAPNLAKWDKNTAINEADHHNITGVELGALPGKMLTGVKVMRGANGNLVFWGATGVAPGDVAVGGGGPGGAAGAAGAADASAAGGAAGAAGSSGGAGGVTTNGGGGASSGGSVSGAAGTTSSAGSFATAPSMSDESGCTLAASSTPARRGHTFVWLLVLAGFFRRRTPA